MINGAHILFYSTDADADRTFLRDVLGFRGVDAGGGWLIFALPPAEAAVHPADGVEGGAPGLFGAHVYLVCDDVRKQVAELKSQGVTCGPLDVQRWGTRTTITLPSGGQIGLYQPTHPTAIGL